MTKTILKLSVVGLVVAGVLSGCASQSSTLDAHAAPAAAATSASGCGVDIAHLSVARAAAATGSALVGMLPTDSALGSYKFGSDSRDFSIQTTWATLQENHIGLNNPNVGASTPVDLVVSFGDFDINASVEGAGVLPPGPGATLPDVHANVRYAIINAMTGQYIGQELKVAGCTD